MKTITIAWADLAARFLPLGVVLIVVAAGLAAIRYVGGRFGSGSDSDSGSGYGS